MNYYVIPKNLSDVQIFLHQETAPSTPFISQSLNHYLNKITTYVRFLQSMHPDSIRDIITQCNCSYKYLYTNIPDTILPVSKIKDMSSVFYELTELFQTIRMTDDAPLFDMTFARTSILCISSEYISMQCAVDAFLSSSKFDKASFYYRNYTTPTDAMLDASHICSKESLIVCELEPSRYTQIQQYIKDMIQILYILTTRQKNRGTAIIKLNNIFHKPIIDIIFILSTFYNKTIITKPAVINNSESYKYIICQQFNASLCSQLNLEQQIRHKLHVFHSEIIDVHSILRNPISQCFLNKLEDINIILGQQQINTCDNIISLFKCKNREDKLEQLKKTNIQKCITWCEKFNISHNRFVERLNIFFGSLSHPNIVA